MQLRRFTIPVAALVLILGVSGGLYAQLYTAAIDGRVTDQTGAVLPGVNVTITSPVLIRPQMATTTETGAYRFAELPIGTYTITFELAGFQTVIREGIILTAGMTATVNAELGLAQVAETVTVSGESPVVDLRATNVAESFDNQRLENVPTSRDPWVIIEQTPGIVMDRQNVGGNESGQQSSWSTRGTPTEQNIWYYDGVNITDMAASGASPMYFDFGAFEEINVATGGQDTGMQTSGTYLNFVVKQGTNQYSGQGAYYFTNPEKWDWMQSDNITPELQEQGAGAGAPIQDIDDYGFDIGGPVIPDRLYAWGSYGVQDIKRGTVGFLRPGCDDPEDPACLEPDPTKLENNNIKINAQITENNKFHFLWARNAKTRGTRGAGPTRPLETTWRQGGPTNIYKFEDTHIFNPNFLVTGRFAYVSGGFFLAYQEDSLRDVQGKLDVNTFAFADSFLDYRTERPQYVANLDGNYFVSNALGGDHEFKFGFQYKQATIDSFTTYGGDVWAISAGDESLEAWFFRPGSAGYSGDYFSLHIQDVFTTGNATLKLGVRYDYQKGQNDSSTLEANQVIPDRMPAITFPGDDGHDAWNNLSPRLGFTYDLSGDGRTVLKANYGLYYDLLLLGDVIAFNNPAGVSSWYLPWTDLNGDGDVQGSEVDFETTLSTGNFNPEDPAGLVSPDVRDPDLTPPKTHELVAGIEQEVMPNLAVRGNYIYKRFTNQFWDEWPYSGNAGTDGMHGLEFPLVDANFQPIPNSAFVPASLDFEGQTLRYFELGGDFVRGGDYLTNRPDYYRQFSGVELGMSKRMADRWMMNVAYTFGSATENFGSDAGIYDPTNIELRREGQVGDFSAGSGKRRFFMNSRWVFRLDGAVQLPGDVLFSGSLNGRQGFPFIESVRTPNRGGALGRGEIMFAPPGETRLENLWVTNFRAEKDFNFGPAQASVMLDMFNLFNEATVLKREQRQDLSNSNDIQDILSPRVFRIGLRFRF